MHGLAFIPNLSLRGPWNRRIVARESGRGARVCTVLTHASALPDLGFLLLLSLDSLVVLLVGGLLALKEPAADGFSFPCQKRGAFL